MTDRYVGIRPAAFDAIVDRHRLTPVEQAVLLRVLLAADHRTGETRGTVSYFAELLGIDRKNLRPKFDRLVAAGLLEAKFPKGHQGTVTALCYLDLVYMPASQVANHPLRRTGAGQVISGDLPPYGDPPPAERVSGETPHARGRIATCDQDPLSGLSAHTALGEQTEPRDPVSPPGGADVPSSSDVPADGPAEARRALREGRANRDGVDEEIPLTSSPSLGSTPGRGHKQVAARDEQQSPGLSSASPSMSRGSDGGANDGTPVHPRSRNDTAKAFAAHVPAERDHRATAPDTDERDAVA